MRKAGILLPVSSLPSRYGIGTFGKTAYRFVDFLAKAGQSYWQVLPMGPTGFGDSPYQSASAFAGNPYYIDLPALMNADLLLSEEVGEDWGADETKVDYGLLFQKRNNVLAKAVARQNKNEESFVRFCEKNSGWLEDYALYMAIKEAYDYSGFSTWPEPLRLRELSAIEAAKIQYSERVIFWKCVQYFFYNQWKALKRYANQKGIEIIGDIPIYVSDDSSDLWASPELFQTDTARKLTFVAGVPPDSFSRTGQLWGNPLYNWEEHKKAGYAWWLQRLVHAKENFDVSRIDHFRGFADYYAIPAGAKDACVGEWIVAPGKDFIRTVHEKLPELQIIAEDLGFLNQDVRELLAFSGYPGMKVLQFSFDPKGDSEYLPHNYSKNVLVYTGTHDNATTLEWELTAPKAEVEFAREYLGVTEKQNITSKLISAAFESVAQTAIIPMQDWLNLGEEARFNIPSTLGGNNWRWRMNETDFDDALAQRIYRQSFLYGRLSTTAKEKIKIKEQQEERKEEIDATNKAKNSLQEK